MTPTFHWVFLLALVGRAASMPRPLVVDACALLCNPGAETESERERDPVLFPRYPKVNCKLQSNSDEHQAWVIASHCTKLCNNELSIPSEVNCFALRSSLQANLGCYCEALTPLSPNTMRLHESWRLNFLVKELASDILNTILSSPLDTIILCEIHQELFKDISLKTGKLVDNCVKEDEAENITTTPAPPRKERSLDEQMMTNLPPAWEAPLDHPDDMYDLEDEVTVETVDETYEPKDKLTDKPTDEPRDNSMDDLMELTDEELHALMKDKLLRHKLYPPPLHDITPPDQDQEKPIDQFLGDWKRVCKVMCQYESGNQFCQCKNPQLGR